MLTPPWIAPRAWTKDMDHTAANAADLIGLESHFSAHNYHPLDIVLTRGEGIWVHDTDGNRYLDFLAAYSAVNQGHNHPRIVQALVAQAKELSLTSRAFRNDRFGPFCQKLAQLLATPTVPCAAAVFRARGERSVRRAPGAQL